MAVLKTINRKGKYHDRHAFRNIISYILNANKVDDAHWVLRSISDQSRAAEEMLRIYNLYQKKSVCLYHMVLSFADDDQVLAREAYGIAYGISDFFADRYQFVAAVHNDAKHVHIHFAWNAVSFVDGKKYHGSPEAFYRLLQLIRELTEEVNPQIKIHVAKNTKRKS